MEEIFVRDKETQQLVSNFGNIIGSKGKTRRLKLDRYGYLVCGFYIRRIKKMKWIPVHRLVARNFIPNPEGKPCINHKDENKKNNVVSNLEWCSVQENNTYGKRMERVKRSLRNGGIQKMLTNHKLNGGKKSQREITLQFKDSGIIRTFVSISEASRQLKITRSSINRVFLGKIRTAGGWHLAGEKYQPIAKNIVFEKDGKVHRFNSQTEAKKVIGCSDYYLEKFKREGCGDYKGWSFIGGAE